MNFRISLAGVKSKSILLNFFLISSLIPLLIAIYIIFDYMIPIIGARGDNVFYNALYAMILLPLLSFLPLYRWVNSLESVTMEIKSKSTAVADREEEFANQRIEINALSAISKKHQENEIHTLIRSFNAIFQAAADQLAERNRLREFLARLIGISSSLTAELDFDRLFPLIVAKLTETMSAERTSLYVVDRDKREIWTRVSEGVTPFRIPLGQGISGHVAETGKMINVADAWELPYFDRSFDLKNNFRTRSVLCIPIKNRLSETIGVLQLINKRDKACFDVEDETFLTALTSQVAIALENSLLVDELLLSFTSFVSTLSAAVDAKHPFTAGHSERVKEYSLMIAEEMQLPKDERETLKYAALLHDIGKIGIRDDILMKVGTYTLKDWEEMKTHTDKTKAILNNFHFPPSLREVTEIAYRHHERIDGSGYPDGLIGDQFPLGAKIIAVADVFDALTSRRDYPKYAVADRPLNFEPMPLFQVIDLLKDQGGNKFDLQVVEAFMQSLSKALFHYRGEHFPPAYVDDMIREINPELLS